jgi:hypothetical protein
MRIVGLAGIQIGRRYALWTDRLRSYKVRIDGEQVGELRPEDETTFDVEPGWHEVQLAIDWARSQRMRVQLADGEKVRLVCHGRNPLLALYWITLGRSRYIALERADEARRG